MPHAFASRFEGVKRKTGGGFLVKCPSHEDRQASLSIDSRDGKILLKCFAGCTVEDIMAAKGLTPADLRLGSSPSKPAEVTVESLATSKGLSVETLTRYGVRNVKDLPPAERLLHGIGGSDGIWIPYFNPDGSITGRTRLRTAHVAKDGSRWLGGFGAILPYGLHDLEDAKRQGLICLCEGESDYWTLREAGLPALGIPGAQMVRSLQREHVAGIAAVYVCQDSDPAGAGFVAGVRQHLAAWGQTSVFAVPMPSGCKDVNDLYRKDPKGFADRMLALIQKAAAAGAPPAREFSTAGEVYTLTAPEWGLRLELDQVRRAWGDLVGEIAITSDTVGDLSRATVNLSSIEKRQAFAAGVAKRSGLAEVDWPALLEDFAIRCLKAERHGAPSIDLREAALPPPDGGWRVGEFILAQHWPSCLFGDGGTGKSYLALHALGELARRGVRVLYVDGEFDASVHRQRLERLFGSDMPPVRYLRLVQPLAYAVDQVKREVLTHQIDYIAVDSVGVLTVDAPEKAEAALGYVRALRQIGVGSLSIAHVTKNGDIPPQHQKPFGSVFYHNSFRRTYFAKQAEDDTGGPVRLVIWNPKVNEGRQQRAFGLELAFGEQTTIRGVDAAGVEGLAEKLPIRRRLQALLRKGPQTSGWLAESLGASDRAVRQALTRGEGSDFVKVPSDGGMSWALCANTPTGYRE